MAKSPKRSGDEATPDTPSAAEIQAIIEGSHGDPFAFLGVHEAGAGHVARCFIPGAETVVAHNLAGEPIGELVRHHDAGFFSGPVKLDGVLPVRYRATRSDAEWTVTDPYSFWPILGPMVLSCVALDAQAEGALRALGVADSKQFGAGLKAHAARSALVQHIHAHARHIELVVIEVEEIDARTRRGLLYDLDGDGDLDEWATHADLSDLDAALAAVFDVDEGRTNPFLHLAMHLSISEQCSIDQPRGIRQAVELLAARRGSLHDAHHEVMECLGEMIWESQRSGQPPRRPHSRKVFLGVIVGRAGGRRSDAGERAAGAGVRRDGPLEGRGAAV